MKLLPIFLGFKIRHNGWGLPTLWFPLVLLWPILFILMFIIFFAGLTAIVILDTRSVRRFFQLFGGVYLAICELRGIRVDVENHEHQIFISIV